MEDNEQLLPENDPTSTSLERKQAAMLQRLSDLHQSRISQKSNLNSDLPIQSTQSFLSTFSNYKLRVESDLTRMQQTPKPHPNPSLVKPDLQKIADSISQLEKLVAESSYFLPSYEIRTCLKSISDLKQSLEQVTAEVTPRKKFSFKNKSRPSQNDIVRETKIPNETTLGNSIDNVVDKVYDVPGFKEKENEVLVKEFNRDGDGGEFMLTDLKGCDVRLMGCFRALFVHRLKGCKVYVGPVFGSVLIEEVEDCVFVLASHQIRIHHANGCDFYLRVRSRPIIEDCGRLRFAPYCLTYGGIEKDLDNANLGEETGNWANVDDFRWLRAVQSPNWSVLPESERVRTLCI